MPNARRVIDPFVGTGTTPLALASLGVECGYCEVNPLLQTVVRTKLYVAMSSRKHREALSARIFELSEKLRSVGLVAPQDSSIADSYVDCFGKSVFFEVETFATVLRLRTFADQLSESDPELGGVLTLAIVSNLVACSLLKRAGDVRYKTVAERGRGIAALLPSVVSQLRQMALDCMRCPEAVVPARFLCADAKGLSYVPSFEAEGVITSPPYLNGTNYVRNTKLELWFLREIASPADLRDARDKVVTSGICDVTSKKGLTEVTPEIAAVVKEIERRSYDRRIPRMIAAYFEDMLAVLRGLQVHTVPEAVVCIDIGDSRYGGVHVPTQNLLAGVGEVAGFRLVTSLRLRSRLSKDRTELSQDLLVFKKKKTAPTATRSWRERWHWFKTQKPHQTKPYAQRNWGNPLHSICSFQGKMKPALAHFLVTSFTEPGQTVLDPFSGAGTIPFEAALSGRKATGFDISTLAFAVSSSKLVPPSRDNLEALLRELNTFISNDQPSEGEINDCSEIRFNRPIPEYFHERTLLEILSARKFFREHEKSPAWSFALACMLHILHGNRPYALSRRSHPITPFAPSGQTTYSSVMQKLRTKIERSLEVQLSSTFVQGACYKLDVLAEWPADIREFDAIITSPPFFDSTRFYMTNWMRYWFCGWSRSDFETAPQKFIESLQKKSMSTYSQVFARFRDHLKSSGVVVLHLGRSQKSDMANELSQIAGEYFKVEDTFLEDVTHCEKHGLRDKGTVVEHQFLVLAKR
jgi:hypothetical protein